MLNTTYNRPSIYNSMYAYHMMSVYMHIYIYDTCIYDTCMLHTIYIRRSHDEGEIVYAVYLYELN